MNNRVVVSFTRFGKSVPRNYPELRQDVSVVSEGDDVFAALSMAYSGAINVLREWQRVAVRTDISTNGEHDVDDNLKPNFANAFKDKEIERKEKRLRLEKDVGELVANGKEILKIIRKSENEEDVKERLMSELGMDGESAERALHLRLDMFTRDAGELRERLMEDEG